MKSFLILALMACAVPALAVYEVGDNVKDMCWQDLNDKKVCLSDKDKTQTIKVLLYNAGWCPPCNDEFDELAPEVGKYDGKPVTFISLSAEGFSHGSAPNATFLMQWKDKHKIPFVVAASPKDAGKQFQTPPLYIPNVAIIGADGKLAYKAVSPGAEAILEQVDKLLGK